MIFSTTHKAKGLGWSDVYLAEDFIAFGKGPRELFNLRSTGVNAWDGQGMTDAQWRAAVSFLADTVVS